MGKRDTRLRVIGSRVAQHDSRIAKPEPKRADAFYQSPEWRALVTGLITRRGRRCEQCGKIREDDGSPVRLIGDHVQERRDGGAELDPANIQLLCSRSGGDGRARPGGSTGNCHAAKTAEATARRLSG